MFEFACIYCPDIGDEEHVEQQLVFTKGPESVEEFVKLIGVAQGIAELAYSFDHTSPAKWFKTGRGQSAKLVLIVPVVNSSSDWRSGYWFAGQVPLNGSTWPPEAMYRHIQLAYEQWHFLNGPVLEEKWPDLTLAEMPDLCSVVAPDCIRLAAGTLSPTAKAGIEKIRQQAGATDILITSVDDGAAVWPGQHLNVESRICIQRWLARATKHRPANKAPMSDTSLTATDTRDQDSDQDSDRDSGQVVGLQDGDRSEQQAERLLAPAPAREQMAPTQARSSTEDAGEIDVAAERVQAQAEPPSSQGSSWFSMPKVASLSISNMPSMTMPSVKMPSMPSVSMPSMSMPDMSAMNSYLPSSLRSWLDSAETQAAEDASDEPGFVYANFVAYDATDDSKLYITAFRRALFVYFLVFREPTAAKHKDLTAHFEALVAQLEGFSFAFAPPTRFNYMIIDHAQRAITSTFSNAMSTEILSTLLSPPDEKPQVIRVGPTWLYFVTLKDGAAAVFGKKGVSSQQGSLLGALHNDVHQWLVDYERRAL